MTYAVVPFSPDHFAALKIPRVLQPFAVHYVRHGLGFTALVDGQPVFAAGVCRMWSGVGEAWQFLTPDASRYPFLVYRSVCRYFPRLIDAMRLRRVQCTVAADDVGGHKWAQALGFTVEGVLKRFGLTGQDYVLYSRVKE